MGKLFLEFFAVLAITVFLIIAINQVVKYIFKPKSKPSSVSSLDELDSKVDKAVDVYKDAKNTVKETEDKINLINSKLKKND